MRRRVIIALLFAACVAYAQDWHTLGALWTEPGAVRPWNPSNVLSSVGAWYDFSDPVFVQTSGSYITNVLDKSGNSLNVSSPSGSARPTLTNALNNSTVAYFNGGQYLLKLTSGIGRNKTNLTVISVICPKSVAGGQGLQFSIANSSVSGRRFESGYSATNIIYSGVRRLDADSFSTLYATNDTFSGWLVRSDVCIYGTSNFTMRAQSATVASRLFGTAGSSQDSDSGAFAVGAGYSGVTPFIGWIAELIVLYGTNDLYNTETYLRSKWGVQ